MKKLLWLSLLLLCWLPGYTQLCNAVLLLKSSPAITYAVWNPSDHGAGVTLSVSDLDATCTGTSSVRATIPIHANQYFEVLVTGVGTNMVIGVANLAANMAQYVGQNTNSLGCYGSASLYGGSYLYNGSLGGSGFTSYSTGDWIGVAYSGTIVQFYKNGIVNGSPVNLASIGLTGVIYPAFGNGGSTTSSHANFGQSPWAFAPPAGYSGVH